MCFNTPFFSLLSDVPGPVGMPLLTENLTNDSCKLSWFTPEDDGGSPITNYIIEKRESDHRAWTPVTYTVTRQNATIQGLIQGKAYFFRIAAENIIGMGPFTETTKEILIREPISKNFFAFNCHMRLIHRKILNMQRNESTLFLLYSQLFLTVQKTWK